MQRLIYPMKTISFSQLEYSQYSHKNIPAVDMTGEDSGIDVCYAPCDMKVIGIRAYPSNTVYFGSLEKVECADGIVRQVTIAMTHMNDISKFKVGQIFKAGAICYKEGTAGQATGNHLHLEIANGLHASKEYVTIDGKRYWRFSEKDALKPTSVFFALEGWNKTRNLMGVNLIWCDNRNFTPKEYDMKLKMYTAKGTQAVRETISFKNKTPNGKLLAIIPKGNKEAIITGFIEGIQKDGYQWVSVDYNGILGYCQWDSQWFEVFEY